MTVSNAAEIKEEEYKTALVELLYGLADDDFITAYRGSEWLGLAPHIEEDVAFSSINQDTMGHAAMFYRLLEDLGEGEMNSLAHARGAENRRNAIILEEVNGSGTYLVEPNYDWAFAVVRNYFYAQAKKIKIDSLKNSSYQPLADAAVKVNMELYYHLLHWKTWFSQLMNSNEEARKRMMKAVEKTAADFAGVLSLGDQGEEMAKAGLIEGEGMLVMRWKNAVKPIFESCNLSLPQLEMKRGNGRNKVHTPDLEQAIGTLSEVYNSDPAAAW
jgi:ring-1,2-phenylacetyl-CoA epoxidase subunit PaaC